MVRQHRLGAQELGLSGHQTSQSPLTTCGGLSPLYTKGASLPRQIQPAKKVCLGGILPANYDLIVIFLQKPEPQENLRLWGFYDRVRERRLAVRPPDPGMHPGPFRVMVYHTRSREARNASPPETGTAVPTRDPSASFGCSVTLPSRGVDPLPTGSPPDEWAATAG